MKFVPQPKPKSLKAMLIKAVASSIVGTGLIGASLFVSTTFAQDAIMATPEQGTQGDVMDNRPVAKGSPQDLVEKHDCWTGEAPKDMEGVMPGHVIVTKGVAPVYGGSHLVGQALEQIFEGKDHGLTVHGFCR